MKTQSDFVTNVARQCSTARYKN